MLGILSMIFVVVTAFVFHWSIISCLHQLLMENIVENANMHSVQIEIYLTILWVTKFLLKSIFSNPKMLG